MLLFETTSAMKSRQTRDIGHAELNVAAPPVHFLPDHLVQLLDIALNCPSVCPPRLASYIINKVISMPAPSPKAAMTWLHFANWQMPQVRV